MAFPDVLDETLLQTEGGWGTAVIMNFAGVRGKPNPGKPSIEVTQETTQDAALRFRGQRVTLLNFASGVSPGGGVRYGAAAQEEALCLCSGLLHGLEALPDYYEMNQADDAPLDCYDRMIWSEEVPMVRDGSFDPVEPMPVQVITYPAPNVFKREYLGQGRVQKASLKEQAGPTFERRCIHIVQRAEKYGTDVLVLGAWGCGAYGNDPAIVARAFKSAIRSHSGSIKQVVFAVYGRPASNYETFKAVFNS